MESALARTLRAVYDDLVRFETELWNGVDARLKAEHGTSLATFEFQQVVAQTKACRVQDVAASIAVTVGGVSKTVDRMVTAGLLARVPHPTDRRSSLLELTDKGEAVLAEVGATFDEELRHRLAFVVTAEELAAFGSTLRKLRSAPEGVR